MNVFLWITSSTVTCLVLIDRSTMECMFMAKHSIAWSNLSLGFVDCQYFFPSAFFCKLCFVVFSFHPFFDVVAITHCFVEARGVGITDTYLVH